MTNDPRDLFEQVSTWTERGRPPEYIVDDLKAASPDERLPYYRDMAAEMRQAIARTDEWLETGEDEPAKRPAAIAFRDVYVAMLPYIDAKVMELATGERHLIDLPALAEAWQAEGRSQEDIS